jgi:hypothetical protein
MAMQLNFSNMLHFLSAIAPILLVFCLVLISLFNSDVKGWIYLGGVLIASVINLFLLNAFKVRPPGNTGLSEYCKLISFPLNLDEYIVPAYNTMIIAFTFMYLYMPMLYISNVNYGMIVFLIALFMSDSWSKYTNGCTNMYGIVVGAVVGLVLGIAWFATFYFSDNKSLLFFGAEPSSNNVVCSRPAKQSFKCSLYKNGTIIGSTSANA